MSTHGGSAGIQINACTSRGDPEEEEARCSTSTTGNSPRSSAPRGGRSSATPGGVSSHGDCRELIRGLQPLPPWPWSLPPNSGAISSRSAPKSPRRRASPWESRPLPPRDKRARRRVGLRRGRFARPAFERRAPARRPRLRTGRRPHPSCAPFRGAARGGASRRAGPVARCTGGRAGCGDANIPICVCQ